MPEYSNIQTFIKLDGFNFKPLLEGFREYVKRIGLWNEDVEKAVDKFEWMNDDGYVTTTLSVLDHFHCDLVGLNIRPHLTVYTPAIVKTLKKNWACCELLIVSEELRNHENGEFHAQAYEKVRNLALPMVELFNETGTYFTDEAQDGGGFDSLVCDDRTKLWEFDYALIPTALSSKYSKKPKTHTLIDHGDYLEAWYIDRWKEGK